MSKKRKFSDIEGVDRSLVEIYNNLADEREDVRLSAAHGLVSRTLDLETTTTDRVKVAISRLCRGLCSSRKAARLGFCVALTELIMQLQKADIGKGLNASYLIDILESQTVPEGQASGQDERDHYLGRLFGAGAVISSRFLFEKQDLAQWQRLLDLVCGIAARKPWLRQECGWILFNSVKSFVSNPNLEAFAVCVLEKLNAHKLIRTPEGLAIWIVTHKQFPYAKLPNNVWRHGDPFAKKDVSSLADVLKDAKAQPTLDDGFESQGSAMWTANLHFAWDIVLSELYSLQHTQNGSKKGEKDTKRTDFETFWAKAVDENLFSQSASVERKHWGLLVLCTVINEAPPDIWKYFFTKTTIRALMNGMKGEDRYLQRTSKKVFQSLQARLSKDPKVKNECLVGLLEGSSFVDIDSVTKTKTLEKLLTAQEWSTDKSIQDTLVKYLKHPHAMEPNETHRRRKLIINLQSKAFELQLSQPLQDYDPSSETSDLSASILLGILRSWVDALYFSKLNDSNDSPEMTTETRNYIKERLAASFEYGLKSGLIGRRLLRQALVLIRHRIAEGEEPIADFDEDVEDTVQRAWKSMCRIPTSWVSRNTESSSWESDPDIEDDEIDVEGVSGTAFDDGLMMLYCLTLFQVYNGEAEAVEILEDLLAYHKGLDGESKAHPKDEVDSSDTLVEVLLSFASKPSKFQRRLTLQVFETLAPQITRRGLQSLTRVLATKETTQGQQEMFEAAEIESDVEDDESDSDVKMIGSDVESISQAESSAGLSGNGSQDGSQNDEDSDGELAEFEAKLAKALGTRKAEEDLEADDTSGGSDSDMGDDQMMELDDKLAEVFRSRKQVPNKRKEARDAKETIVQFKNRVIDFVEVYLKHEYLSPLSLELILPLLRLARKTNTKQLADRACSILRDFCSRCKGQNVPALQIDKEESIEEVVKTLRAVHDEAGLEGSNARAAACSSASILLVKMLLNGGSELRLIIDIYGDTRVRQLTDKTCKVQAAFFTDWNNWCAQARNQLAR